MRYLALIYDAEPDPGTFSPDDLDTMLAEYGAFDAAVKAAGVFLGGEALQSSDTATVVRVRDGQRLTTDGPFAETREQLGGYYLLECADLDEAIAWAARIPGASVGAVEIRPIMEIDFGG
jgi:hypothetical protein